MRRRQDKSFVFKLFDIFKHLRGSGTVDKIKKTPSGVVTDLGHRDSLQPSASANPDGRGR